MSINFLLEISVGTIIVFLVLYLCYIVIPGSKKVREFIIKYKKHLSPDCISNWRMYLGFPVIGLYFIGFYTENILIIHISIWLFVFLAATDALDGIVARYCNMTTSKGAILDAKADKWFDLPTLFAFSLFPVFSPSYLIIVIFIATFDIIGQYMRGKNSPPEAGIIGKAKTTIKFIVIYLMTLAERYTEIYNLLNLETIIPILLVIAAILAGISMGIKTKWYNEYLRKYLKEYL